MSSASASSAPFTARSGLMRLAAFGGVGLALSLARAGGVGLPCPWRYLTGTRCPLCGATHVGAQLVRLDVAGAFAANPFVFCGLVVLGVLGVLWAVEAAGGPAVRWPAALRGAGDRWWLAIGVLAVTFAVLRNIW